jgi:hypothetical protein
MTREKYGIIAAQRTVPVLESIAKPDYEVVSVLFKVHGILRTIFMKVSWCYLT